MPHESLTRRQEVPGSSNRSFGLVFAAVFALVALVPWLAGGALRWWALALGAVFLLVALAFPAKLAKLNRAWYKLGLLLHRIVSPLVLGLMFFVAITPIGLLMRALGKDPLRLKRDPQATTYWIERIPPGPAPESLRDQF
jgi:hypothetical protein